MTYDGATNIALYVDGIIETSSYFNNNLSGSIINTGTTEIGCYDGNGNPGEFWNGLIENLAIYDTKRTQLQIQESFYCPPPDVSFIGYWNFNTESTVSINDLSSNGNNGVIYGGAFNTDIPLSCQSNLSYAWSSSETTSSIWAAPSQNTNYSVTIDDGIGFCTKDREVEVTIIDPDLGEGEFVCANDSIGLSPELPGYSHLWSTGETTEAIYVSEEGIYSVTVTDITLGCSEIDSVIVTEVPVNESIDIQTACDTYTWIDGNTYTESNTSAIFIETDLIGCDSLIVSLNLTMNSSNSWT